jgi:VWFA-related protein
MRRLLVCVLLAALVRVGDAAQNAQSPADVFRSQVNLLTIDVSATDSRGRPVEDLEPADFTVRVDGKPRPVASAELIRVDRAKPAGPARPVDALIATNVSPQNARRIIVAVDQTLISPGTLTPLLRTAGQFVDRLLPVDYAAFIGFPEPGPRVDFTTDKALVHKAMQGINIGQPDKVLTSQFDTSLGEAFNITGAESVVNRSKDSPPGPVMERVLARAMEADLCPPPPIDCKAMIYNDAMSLMADGRANGTISLRALEALLKDLVPLEGPKTMVVFSGGLLNEDPTRLDDLAKLAAAARTTINMIAVDSSREQANLTRQTAPFMSSIADRAFELEGLEGIADRTSGIFRRGIASGAGIFEELERQLSAWYLVAVERQPGDPESQRIEIAVKRRGVTARSNKNAVATTLAARTRPMEELLSDVLASPFTIPGLPIRLSTFAQRDGSSGKYRLRLAADVGQPGEPAGEFAVGYVLTTANGRSVTSAGVRRTLTPAATGSRQTLTYDTVLSIDPGTYALRFAAVDKEGRRGAVVSRLELPQPATGEIGMSDLIVGNLPAEGASLSPRVEPLITASELAAYLELYLPDAVTGNVTVTLDVAEGDASPALASQALTLRPGETPASRVATGFVPVTMTPGQYVARATVLRDGLAVRTLTRPIRIVRDPAVVSRAPIRPRGVPISQRLQESTAAYVAQMVNGLGNVVALEEFTLSGPNRRVASDLLLVRYPGRVRDLISYRDVTQVNGKPLPGREQRLLELFAPTDAFREQAKKIMESGSAYVPTAFNPMFVLGFLQTDFQRRFEFTVNEAGPEWPREVKAVTFAEIGRPTLLRAGQFGDVDAPSRGTAWIEEATGRILQTELEIGRGRSAPKMTTKFRLDDRLQVTVPVEMRTENPDGVATYTNFRRFGVETDTTIPVPPAPHQPSDRR